MKFSNKREGVVSEKELAYVRRQKERREEWFGRGPLSDELARTLDQIDIDRPGWVDVNACVLDACGEDAIDASAWALAHWISMPGTLSRKVGMAPMDTDAWVSVGFNLLREARHSRGEKLPDEASHSAEATKILAEGLIAVSRDIDE